MTLDVRDSNIVSRPADQLANVDIMALYKELKSLKSPVGGNGAGNGPSLSFFDDRCFVAHFRGPEGTFHRIFDANGNVVRKHQGEYDFGTGPCRKIW